MDAGVISLLQDIDSPPQLLNMQVALVLLSIVAFAAAAPSATYDHKPVYPVHQTYKHKEYDYAPAHYNFDYAVKDDYAYLNFGHNENRDGDHTKGQYFVDLPDGRRQVVTYYVDGYSGYVADVKYEGHAKYDHKADYKPAYKPKY